ncbi:hypothetical protein LSG31_04650 [Fodinisporobacter ferrooxydans]|uniref:Uncharacterized protein n=1 Tax=Fodinisporobacter ferrooxydans TaxID=2901836 RepID=A0ABY4CM20_9BACL|nr:hypothetical protein LSG31_04650 [Alicyclobacillaceae bacterium MYW30-H2]
MNKHKKWNTIIDNYFDDITVDQFIEDSRKAGIILKQQPGVKKGKILRITTGNKKFRQSNNKVNHK